MSQPLSHIPGVERLVDNLHSAVDEADSVLKDVARSGDAKFDAARDRFVGQLRRLRIQLEELQEATAHKARRAARRADDAVQSHPYSAIGLAALAGAIIGALASRRR